MSKALVIVESPAKARTIERYLGKGYEVEATMGHIRDLPSKGLGIDVENDFEPTYEVLSGRKKIVATLRRKAAKADAVYLAVDLDREGEAIAWHVKEAIKFPEEKIFRVTFNEITKSAIKKAFESPGRISLDRVYAQQARRILDRLVGYSISPLLWRRIPNVLPKGRRLSAGRVQSVAVRLIVEREREIEAFDQKEFWRIAALLKADGEELRAELELKNGKKFEIADEETTRAILDDLNGADYNVAGVTAKKTKSNPAPPFTTSTLQQAAATQLRFAAKRTMRIAQQLYEGVSLGPEGSVALITYMRTDSVRISNDAIGDIRDLITEKYGKDFLPARPKAYKSKKGAQEAHEAIRPTYIARTPESVKQHLSDDLYKLYSLIWRRAIASQMTPAVFDVTTANIDAGKYTFIARGRVLVFAGHSVLGLGSKSEDALLPALVEGRTLDLDKLEDTQHFTQPPGRYTEASLVKMLEREGIGRPSTYASIISTIQDRSYVTQEKRVFRPTHLGAFVTDKLVKHFPNILDVHFTSSMEDGLDEVESGNKAWLKLITEFYDPFKKSVEAAMDEMAPFEETDEKCPQCESPLRKRLSRSGMFLACSGYPECKFTRTLSATGAPIEFEEKPCPACGKILSLRGGPKGPFVGCTGWPECKYTATVEDPEGGSVADEKTNGSEAPERECPDCKKALVIRNGSRGEFWGCTGYPKCRHTEAIESEGGEDGEDSGDKDENAEGKKCPNCDSLLVVKNGLRGKFLACPGYPKCKHAESISGDGGKDAGASDGKDENSEGKKCPNCESLLVVKNGRRGKFLACPGYPKCKHAEPLSGDAGAPAKAAPEKLGRECPECGKELLLRKGPRGSFVGCSGYPKCKHTE